MEGEQSPELATAWKKEKWWFQRTTGFTVVLMIGLVMGGGGQYWSFVRLSEAFPSFAATRTVTSLTGPDESAAIQTALYPGSVVTLIGLTVALVSGIGFLVSLVKWLLAILHRRALHAASIASLDP